MRFFLLKRPLSNVHESLRNQFYQKVLKLPAPKKNIPSQRKNFTKIVMWRQIKNDSIQLPLKLLAWKLSGNPTGPFYAQLVRSFIDFLNHATLTGASFLNLQSSKRYPYGLQKFKNLIVCVPGCFFLFCGIENLIEGVLADSGHQPESSVATLLIYVTSLLVQSFVVYKNVKDAQNMSGGSSQKLSIGKRLSRIIKGKDPLLQAILYQNAVTVSSTLIPLTFTLLEQTITMPLGNVANSFIGVIELYLGTHILSQNLQILLGQPLVDKETIKKIERECKKNRFVKQVTNIDAKLIGPEKFRFTCHVTLDDFKIGQFMLEQYEQSIQRICFNQADQRQAIDSLMDICTTRVFMIVQSQLHSIEQNITQQFPECTFVDIQLDHSKQLNRINRKGLSPKTLLDTNFPVLEVNQLQVLSVQQTQTQEDEEEDLRFGVLKERLKQFRKEDYLQ